MSQIVPLERPAEFDFVLTFIEADPGLADSTKVKYCRVLRAYRDAGGRLTDSARLGEFAAQISASRRAQLRGALKHYVRFLTTELKATVTPATVAATQAALWRLEALLEVIKSRKPAGQKMGLWLSQKQVKGMLASCADDPKGRRDRVALGLMVGAGLRRDELRRLTFDQLRLAPVGDKFRTVIDLAGKGHKQRQIPISDGLAAALDAWQGEAGPGRVARSVTKGGRLGRSLSAVGIFNLVASAGAAIGLPQLAPHDLRRTYAQIGYDSGISIVQISRLLGHSSVAVTQRYLNLETDLESTVSDFVPF